MAPTASQDTRKDYPDETLPQIRHVLIARAILRLGYALPQQAVDAPLSVDPFGRS